MTFAVTVAIPAVLGYEAICFLQPFHPYLMTRYWVLLSVLLPTVNILDHDTAVSVCVLAIS